MVATVKISGNALTVAEVAIGTSDITITAIDGRGGAINETFSIVVGVSTIIENLNQTKIKVHPNPTNGIIYFEPKFTDIQNIKIYDLVGTLLIDKTGIKVKEIDLSELNTGIYIISIRTDNRCFTTRILKE